MLSIKNGVSKFFKPFCCLLLFSGSLRSIYDTIDTVDRLRKELEKVKMEGEYIMHI